MTKHVSTSAYRKAKTQNGKEEKEVVVNTISICCAESTPFRIHEQKKTLKYEILFNIKLGDLTNYVYLCTCE